MEELRYINLINNVEGAIPNSFIEKYAKFREKRISITPSGISVLIRECQKIGLINVECRSCKDHHTLRVELRGIINTSGDISKGFIVKSKDPYNHLTPIYVKKIGNKILVLITDSQGGEKNYDPSTLYDLKELGGNGIFEIYNLSGKRDFDFTKEGGFAFHDLLIMCKYPELLDKLQTLNLHETYLSYLPDLKFKTITLSDLPSEFSDNIDEHFHTYIKTIKSRMKYEYHVKTTYYGDIITPRGLNMMISLFKDKFKYPTIALENHDQLLKLLRNQKDEIKSYMVKSKDPHDHMTPVFVKKKGNYYEVILSDTQGGVPPHYDFTPLIDFNTLVKEGLK